MRSEINKNHIIEIVPGVYNIELQKAQKKRVYRLKVSDEYFQRFQVK